MAGVIVTFTINPESPDVDLAKLEEQTKKLITEYGGKVGQAVTEPIGFGLKALKIIFVMDEAKGSPDPLEEKISALEGVASVRVTDVSRTG